MIITDDEKAAIKDSWRLVIPIAETAADLFYRRLFELRPEYRRLFTDDLKAQKRKLIAMLAFTVKSLDWPESAWRETVDEEDDLCLVVLALGRRHSDIYKIPDASYDVVGEVLLWTLDYGLGKKFDARTRGAWTHVYQLLSLTMRMGRLSVPGATKADDALSRMVSAAANPANGADGTAEVG